MRKKWLIHLCWVLVLYIGCNTTHSGKREKELDSICAPQKELAYTFEEPKEALSAGCKEARQHMGQTNPATGKTESVEMLFWCCPQ